MGTMQTLLIAFGVVVIGISIAVAVSFAGKTHDNAMHDALLVDCIRLSADAGMYYQRPKVFGGGAGSFNNINVTAIGSGTTTANGRFAIDGSGDFCTIEAESASVPGATITLTLTADGRYTTVSHGW